MNSKFSRRPRVQRTPPVCAARPGYIPSGGIPVGNAPNPSRLIYPQQSPPVGSGGAAGCRPPLPLPARVLVAIHAWVQPIAGPTWGHHTITTWAVRSGPAPHWTASVQTDSGRWDVDLSWHADTEGWILSCYTDETDYAPGTMLWPEYVQSPAAPFTLSLGVIAWETWDQRAEASIAN